MEFHRRFLKAANYPGIGYVRAAIAELADGSKSFKVPMDTQYGKGLVKFRVRSTNADIAAKDVAGSITTAAGQFSALADGNGNAVDIVLLPGAYFTIGNLLYQARATAGEQTVSAGAVSSIPGFPSGTGDAIELDRPYAVGRLPSGSVIRPLESGHASAAAG